MIKSVEGTLSKTLSSGLWWVDTFLGLYQGSSWGLASDMSAWNWDTNPILAKFCLFPFYLLVGDGFWGSLQPAGLIESTWFSENILLPSYFHHELCRAQGHGGCLSIHVGIHSFSKYFFIIWHVSDNDSWGYWNDWVYGEKWVGWLEQVFIFRKGRYLRLMTLFLNVVLFWS